MWKPQIEEAFLAAYNVLAGRGLPNVPGGQLEAELIRAVQREILDNTLFPSEEVAKGYRKQFRNSLNYATAYFEAKTNEELCEVVDKHPSKTMLEVRFSAAVVRAYENEVSNGTEQTGS
jgi:hypothetical protein